MNSLFPDICSTDLIASKKFYESLLGMNTVFELDWYIQMQSPTDSNLQIAFIAKDNQSVPEGYRFEPKGVVITVEMDDIDPTHNRAKELDLQIVQPLKDEEWGQRHFMVRDPNGLLLDLVQMIEPGPTYAPYFQ